MLINIIANYFTWLCLYRLFVGSCPWRYFGYLLRSNRNNVLLFNFVSSFNNYPWFIFWRQNRANVLVFNSHLLLLISLFVNCRFISLLSFITWFLRSADYTISRYSFDCSSIIFWWNEFVVMVNWGLISRPLVDLIIPGIPIIKLLLHDQWHLWFVFLSHLSNNYEFVLAFCLILYLLILLSTTSDSKYYLFCL